MPCVFTAALLACSTASLAAQSADPGTPGVTINYDVLNDLARTAAGAPGASSPAGPAAAALLPPPSRSPRSELLITPAWEAELKPPRKPSALAAKAPALESEAPRAASEAMAGGVPTGQTPQVPVAAEPPRTDLEAWAPAPPLPDVPPAPALAPGDVPLPAAVAPAPDARRTIAAAPPPAMPQLSEVDTVMPVAQPAPERETSETAASGAAAGTGRQPETGAPQVAALPPAKSAFGKVRLLFDEGSAELSSEAKAKLSGLSARLLAERGRRIELKAYSKGEGRGDSRARRLALSRALAVRSFLIDNGIPSRRIDVRALGSRSGDGPEDRVDVLGSRR